MTALHNDDATLAKSRATRRRWTQLLTVGAAAVAVGSIGFAGAAGAAVVTGYRTAGSGTAGSPVLSNATDAKATTVATLADGTAFTADCAVRGRSVGGNTVWHHITAPKAGYIADYYTNTPGFNKIVAGEAVCATPAPEVTPVTPVTTVPVTPETPPTVTRGETINYNEGVGGSCVYYAMDRFHQLTGVYPKALGDALKLATSAAAHGWTVSATPRVNSIAVFQPGDNGAGAGTGHAAWVEQVSGSRIYVSEMNAPRAGVITYRWIDAPAASVRYIYAP